MINPGNMNELDLLLFPTASDAVQMTRTSLVLAETLTVSQWEEIGRGRGSKEKGNELIEPLPVQVGGSLNPEWVCWLMNWPLNWESLKPLSIEEFESWKNATISGTWFQAEPPIPRVSNGVKDRVSRLRALGNGQVPLCAVLAWEILNGG